MFELLLIPHFSFCIWKWWEALVMLQFVASSFI